MIVTVGNFIVDSGELIVSDPCYKPNINMHGVISNARNGNWIAKYDHDITWWGDRILSLTALHESLAETENYPYEFKKYGWKRLGYFGVDSGQFGIYDAGKYPEGERDYDDKNSFYRKVCDLTYDERDHFINGNPPFRGGIIDSFGVVSSSGFGDGYYPVYTKTVDDKVVGVTVVYIFQRDKK